MRSREFIDRMMAGKTGRWNARRFALEGHRLVTAMHRTAQIIQRRAWPIVAAGVLASFRRAAQKTIERALGVQAAKSAEVVDLLFPSNVGLWMQALEAAFEEEGIQAVIELTPPIQSVMAQGYDKTSRLLGEDPDPKYNPEWHRGSQAIARRITGITETTRNHFRQVITGALNEGLSSADLAKRLRTDFPAMEMHRVRTIARTELGNAWTEGTAGALKSSETVTHVSVIGCMEREPNSPQYRGESTCNIEDVPLGELDALMEVGWHPNHSGTLVASRFSDEEI